MSTPATVSPSTKAAQAFTLIELLVVVAILALLISILLPSLGRAKNRATATRCLANLASIGRGLVAYQTANDGYVVPSYNMTGSGGAGPLTVDGWPAILDRDGVVPSSGGLTNNVFFCPNTLDKVGLTASAASAIPIGYQDYPTTFLNGTDGGGQADPNLPAPGFRNASGLYLHEIRCSYWINANNPLGSAKAPSPNPYYTQSVGYTFSDGSKMTPMKASLILRPCALIVASDGIYAGQQKNTRLNEPSSRIGYRHPGTSASANTVTNAVFADGHAEGIESSTFPHASNTAENNSQYSVLAAQ